MLCIVVGGALFSFLHIIVGSSFVLLSWWDLIIYATLVGGGICIIQFIVLYFGSKAMRNLIKRVVGSINKI